MSFKIEFVFLTEACQVLKLSLFESRWRKELQVSQQMQLEIDQKVTLKTDNVDTECVLLKHGTPAAMAVEYKSLGELYGFIIFRPVWERRGCNAKEGCEVDTQGNWNSDSKQRVSNAGEFG